MFVHSHLTNIYTYIYMYTFVENAVHPSPSPLSFCFSHFRNQENLLKSFSIIVNFFQRSYSMSYIYTNTLFPYTYNTLQCLYL